VSVNDHAGWFFSPSCETILSNIFQVDPPAAQEFPADRPRSIPAGPPATDKLLNADLARRARTPKRGAEQRDCAPEHGAPVEEREEHLPGGVPPPPAPTGTVLITHKFSTSAPPGTVLIYQ